MAAEADVSPIEEGSDSFAFCIAMKDADCLTSASSTSLEMGTGACELEVFGPFAAAAFVPIFGLLACEGALALLEAAGWVALLKKPVYTSKK